MVDAVLSGEVSVPKIMLPASIESCTPAMGFLREHAPQEYGEMLGLMELAVEEVLVNVALYAYPEKGGSGSDVSEDSRGMMELGLRRARLDDEPFICVWTRDWGVSFDPFLEAPAPDTTLDAEDRPIGGLGVHLVKNVAVHYSYSRMDDENLIELYFRLPSDGA